MANANDDEDYKEFARLIGRQDTAITAALKTLRQWQTRGDQPPEWRKGITDALTALRDVATTQTDLHAHYAKLRGVSQEEFEALFSAASK